MKKNKKFKLTNHWFEISLILIVALFVITDLIVNFRTELVSTETTNNKGIYTTDISFSGPISRLNLEVSSTPEADFSLDWHNPFFGNTMYQNLSVKNKSELLPNTEYIVTIKGVKTIDRLRKIPVVFTVQAE